MILLGVFSGAPFATWSTGFAQGSAETFPHQIRCFDAVTDDEVLVVAPGFPGSNPFYIQVEEESGTRTCPGNFFGPQVPTPTMTPWFEGTTSNPLGTCRVSLHPSTSHTHWATYLRERRHVGVEAGRVLRCVNSGDARAPITRDVACELQCPSELEVTGGTSSSPRVNFEANGRCLGGLTPQTDVFDRALQKTTLKATVFQFDAHGTPVEGASQVSAPEEAVLSSGKNDFRWFAVTPVSLRDKLPAGGPGFVRFEIVSEMVLARLPDLPRWPASNGTRDPRDAASQQVLRGSKTCDSRLVWRAQ